MWSGQILARQLSSEDFSTYLPPNAALVGVEQQGSYANLYDPECGGQFLPKGSVYSMMCADKPAITYNDNNNDTSHKKHNHNMPSLVCNRLLVNSTM